MNIQYKPFDLIDTIRDNNLSYTHSFTKKVTTADANVEKLQDKAESFRKSVKKLKRYSPGGISREMLTDQAEDLVKSYNAMKNSSDLVTDKDVQKQLSKLDKLFSDSERTLRKAGIEKLNGKYTFDRAAFAEASEKTINTLFTGHDSLVGKADKILRNVEETTDDIQYVTSEYNVSSTLKYEEKDMLTAEYSTIAGQATSTLKLIPSGALSDSSMRDSVRDLLQLFSKSAYRTNSAGKNENIDKLNQLCLDQKDRLAKLGLTFDSGQKNMIFDANVDMTTADFQNTYNELFGRNAAFGNTVIQYSKNVFNDIIKPDQIGVSIIDAQA
ncbi:MAG: hypothetical protein K2P73_14390 [Lachnospiraceae bacterium]|nr:hypothetical protein [Lachnospiraceae bacterium]